MAAFWVVNLEHTSSGQTAAALLLYSLYGSLFGVKPLLLNQAFASSKVPSDLHVTVGSFWHGAQSLSGSNRGRSIVIGQPLHRRLLRAEVIARPALRADAACFCVIELEGVEVLRVPHAVEPVGCLSFIAEFAAGQWCQVLTRHAIAVRIELLGPPRVLRHSFNGL